MKFGFDLTSLIDSELVGKVPRASRSSLRRVRRDFATEQSHTSVLEFNMPLSEPQKCGEKPEQLPLKKRRFVFRSPSPPPVVGSAPVEQTCEVSNIPAASEPSCSGIKSSRNIDTKISIGDAKLENYSAKFDGEDLSGISMLAVVACSSKLAKECDVKQSLEGEGSSLLNRVDESSLDAKLGSSSKVLKGDSVSCSKMSTGGTLLCISTKSVGETASTVDYPSKAVADEKDVKHASVGADLATSSENASCREDEEVAVTHRQCSRDDRFHWDLNVVMDAWDEPVHDFGTHNNAQHEIADDAVENHRDSCGNPVAACAENSSLMLGESKLLTNQASEVNDANYDTSVFDSVSDSISLVEKSIMPRASSVDTVKCKVEDTACTSLQTVETAEGFVVSGSDPERYAQNDLEGFSSTPIVPSAELQDVSNIHHRDFVCPTSNTHTLSDIPSVTPKESCDPHFNETSKANLDNSLNCSDHIENAEVTEVKGGLGGRCNTHSMTGGAAGELQGYDSQYEDGELQESNELARKDVDREAEHVNNGTEITEKCVINTSDRHDSEPGQVDMSNHGKQQLVAVVSSVDSTVLTEAKIVGDDRALEQKNIINPGCSDVNEDLLSGRELPEKTRSSSDMSIDSRAGETVEEPKPFRRALESETEAPISQDGYSRDGRQSRIERFESGSLRSFERTRYSSQYQGRGRHGGSWDGSSNYRRGINHFSPNIYQRSEHTRDALPERENSGCDGIQDDLSRSHQVHPNCQAPADEEPGLHPRYRPGRKFSPDTGEGFGRGRSFRHGVVTESRAERGRYSGPSPDESFQSSLKYRRPLYQRERSLSPLGGRGQPNINHIRGKSPSRLRSRSPIMWNPSRGRPGGVGGVNTFIRHRSRSPNLRSDIRTQRLRSPNQQSGFEADHVTGFRSITRTHNSPPRSRWNSSRKDVLGNFREFSYKQRASDFERMPGRIHLTSDRDTVIDSPRNVKPDGYYRMSDQTSETGAGRAFRYSESYDHRRKNYNYLRPARSSYEDGITKILHHDADDSFRARNNIQDRDAPNFRGRGGFRGLDSHIGDMPRRFRGEQHSYMDE